MVLAASGVAKFAGAQLKLQGLRPGSTYKFVHGSRQGKFKAIFGVASGGAEGMLITEGKVASSKKRASAEANEAQWVVEYGESDTVIGQSADMASDIEENSVSVDPESESESESQREVTDNRSGARVNRVRQTGLLSSLVLIVAEFF